MSGAPGPATPFLGQAHHPQVRRCFWAKTPGGGCAHVETQPLAAVASQEPQHHRPSLCSHLPADCPLDWQCCSPGQRETSPGAASPARWLWRDVQDEGHQMRDEGFRSGLGVKARGQPAAGTWWFCPQNGDKDSQDVTPVLPPSSPGGFERQRHFRMVLASLPRTCRGLGG